MWIMGGFSTERLRIPPSQMRNVILSARRRASRRSLQWLFCESSAARKRLRRSPLVQGLSVMTTVIDAVRLCLAIYKR